MAKINEFTIVSEPNDEFSLHGSLSAEQKFAKVNNVPPEF